MPGIGLERDRSPQSVRRLKKFLVLVMTIVLLVGCQLFGVVESINIRPPTILSFGHEPLEPPPDYSVNVTATISSSRPLLPSGVTVSYFTSIGINQTVLMVFVEGNETLALYFAALPPNSEGTQVTYKIIAIDSSGFHGESKAASYTVKRDLTPPSFESEGPIQPYPNPNVSLTNRTEVQIAVRISDSGSGVKNATLRYSNSTNPSAPAWRTVHMHLAEGDRYDGSWIAVLPAMSNGTVIYEPEAHDFANNKGIGWEMSYDISNPPSPTAQIQITLDNLDFTSKLMTIGIVCAITYDSPYDSFLLDLQQGIGYGEYWINSTRLVVPRAGGSFYFGVLKWRTPMVGAVNFYPFDSYVLDLRMRLSVSGLDRNNTHVVFPFFGLVSWTFNSAITTNQTEIGPNESNMHFAALITRKPNLTSQAIAITQVVYATFFVLGSTTLLSFRREDLANRLRILVGIFTFSGILYFTIAKVLQDAGISEIVGLALPQAMLLALMWSIGVFVVGGLIGVLLEDSGRLQRHHALKVHSLSLSLSGVALLVIIYYSQTSVLGQPRSFLEIDEMRNLVVGGLFYAAVGKVLADFWRHRDQFIDRIIGAGLKSDPVDCSEEDET
jgi:hypothetical protein